MNIKKAIGTILVAAGVGVLGVSAANADINPNPIYASISGTGPYTFTYTPEVSGTETVTSGQFFTFYDVQGLVAGSEAAPTDWAFSESTAVATPPVTGTSGTVTATDDPALTNVTFTYSGKDVVGDQSLGSFSFNSIYPTGTTPEAFGAVANSSDTSHGTIVDANVTTYLGPTISVTGAPEPAMVMPFALAGLGLLAVIVRARKSRRSGAAA